MIIFSGYVIDVISQIVQNAEKQELCIQKLFILTSPIHYEVNLVTVSHARMVYYVVSFIIDMMHRCVGYFL